MTTPHSTRSALSEIPYQLEQLRVATTPTNQMADEPTPANVLNTNDDNPTNNTSLQYTLPIVSSPDEIVIRQRGRRCFTLTWSPDKMSTLKPFQRTPTKIVSHMKLRSSPRKRLIMPDASLQSPAKFTLDNGQKSPMVSSLGLKVSWNAAPSVKKLKLDEKPVAVTNFNTNLHILLKGLSHSQLIDIITDLSTKDSSLDARIRSELPTPDIGPMEDELMQYKRNIFKSLPTSRLCKKTDSTAYAKAALHLSAFKTAILSHTRRLHDSTHWDALLDYVLMAWNYVRSTPVWDNNSHNAIRRHCFKVLTCHCVAALKYGGLRLGAHRLSNIEQNLKEWLRDHEDVISCVNALSKILIQSRTSI